MMQTADGQASSKWYWIFLSLILLVIAWCANPWQLYFFNDDFRHILLSSNGVIGHHNFLRHINDVSLYIDAKLFGHSAAGYHITNLLLHVANILMGIYLLRRISQSLQVPLSTPVTIAVAALFGIYAFHSEALFWVICRTASLSFFFTCLSWICLFKALHSRLWLLPAGIFFLLGIFTYESVWVFPFWLLAWYVLLPAKHTFRHHSALPVAIIWGLFGLYFVVRIMATGEVLNSYEAGDIQSFKLLSVAAKTVKLFGRSFLPPVYNHQLFSLLFAGVLVGLVLWGVVLWKKNRTNRLLLFFTIAWLLSYFPYISLGISTSGYQSERYLYFPSFFLCAFLVYGGWLTWSDNRTKQYLFLAILLGYHLVFFIQSAQVYKQVSSWAKGAIVAMQQVPATKQIVVVALPAFSHGIPVFNYYFSSAILWQMPHRDTSSVQILSTHDFGNQPIYMKHSSQSAIDTVSFYSR